MKEQRDSFSKRLKVTENKIERLKKYLSVYLDGQGFESSTVSISYRNTSSVEVDDITLIDKEYLKYPDPVVDKTAIRADLLNGKNVNGAHFVYNNSIQIK